MIDKSEVTLDKIIHSSEFCHINSYLRSYKLKFQTTFTNNFSNAKIWFTGMSLSEPVDCLLACLICTISSLIWPLAI